MTQPPDDRYGRHSRWLVEAQDPGDGHPTGQQPYAHPAAQEPQQRAPWTPFPDEAGSTRLPLPAPPQRPEHYPASPAVQYEQPGRYPAGPRGPYEQPAQYPAEPRNPYEQPDRYPAGLRGPYEQPDPRGYAPPPPPPPAEPESEPLRMQLGPAVRGAAVDRAVNANTSHARLAAELRGSADALSAHALLVFSADNDGYPFHLSTATRLDLEEETGEDMLEMLDGVTTFARTQITAAQADERRWDPRNPDNLLVTTSETYTTGHSIIGVAVSTLDRKEITWHEARQAVEYRDGLHLPGQAFLYLADGTAAHVTRQPMMGRLAGQHEIVATTTVRSSFTVYEDRRLTLAADQQTELPVWSALRGLADVLSTA